MTSIGFVTQAAVIQLNPPNTNFCHVLSFFTFGNVSTEVELHYHYIPIKYAYHSIGVVVTGRGNSLYMLHS